jgi:hypothetical protein
VWVIKDFAESLRRQVERRVPEQVWSRCCLQVNMRQRRQNV